MGHNSNFVFSIFSFSSTVTLFRLFNSFFLIGGYLRGQCQVGVFGGLDRVLALCVGVWVRWRGIGWEVSECWMELFGGSVGWSARWERLVRALDAWRVVGGTFGWMYWDCIGWAYGVGMWGFLVQTQHTNNTKRPKLHRFVRCRHWQLGARKMRIGGVPTSSQNFPAGFSELSRRGSQKFVFFVFFAISLCVFGKSSSSQNPARGF